MTEQARDWWDSASWDRWYQERVRRLRQLMRQFAEDREQWVYHPPRSDPLPLDTAEVIDQAEEILREARR